MCAQGASTGDVVALAAQLATARAAHKAANDELAEVVNNVANYYNRVESRISQGALRGSSSAPDAALGSGCGGSGGKRRRAPKMCTLTEAALEQARATKAARLDPSTPAHARNPPMALPAVCTSAAASPTAVAATPDAAAPRVVGFGDTVGLEYPDNSHDGLDGNFYVGPNDTELDDDSSIAPIVTTTPVRLVLAAPDDTTPIVATGGVAADGAGAPSAEAAPAPAAAAAVVAAAPIVAPAAAAAVVAAAPIVATTPATAEGELAALIAAALKQ